MRKAIAAIFIIVVIDVASGASFTNSVSADSFVRASAPTSNYGGSGANAVSGTNAASGSAAKNGAFDSFVRFNTFSMVTNFNALYGSNSWAISSATLQVTEQGTPANGLFNRGKGSFEIRWMANDNWTEGTGNPTTPMTTGIVYNDESALLNAALDASLGTFTNAGTDGVLFYTLPLQPSFVADMQAGGEVGLFFTATEPNIGFTFSSRSFTATGRPLLIVSAVPRPGIVSATMSGADLNLSCTNGASGGTYVLLMSPDATLPLNQWTPIATNILATPGGFSVTASNAIGHSAAQQFFTLQTQ